MDQRIGWIDFLKAAGILFVMAGHAPGFSEELHIYTLSFGMPLFFFRSGYLLKRKYLSLSLAGYAARQMRLLLIPYCFFGAVSYALWLVLVRHFLSPGMPLYVPLEGMLYGVNNDRYLIHNSVLWFFPCLFAVRLAYYALARFIRTSMLPVSILMAACFGIMLHDAVPFRIPWSADIALMCLPFYAAGALLQRVRGMKGALNKKLCLLLLPVAAGCHLAGLQYNSMVFLYRGAIGMPAIFYLNAALGIATWVCAGSLIPASRTITRLAKESIVLFPLHCLVYLFISGVFIVLLGLPAEFNNGSILFAAGYVGVTVPVLLRAARVLHRYVPRALGERPRRARLRLEVRPEAAYPAELVHGKWAANITAS
ncbi:MAG: acyltransferase family protein [Acidobacteriota bacterium]